MLGCLLCLHVEVLELTEHLCVGMWRQVSEQVLRSLGVEVCRDLLDKRGLLAALFSPVSVDFFMEVGQSVNPMLYDAHRLARIFDQSGQYAIPRDSMRVSS